jgi:ATP-dependent DNA helicase RecQ
VGCRHKHLSEYFGDSYPSSKCGACDVCLGELESVDEPVTVARKILSSVARVGQRFGAGHVSAVLRGQTTDAVLARGHQELSTFGLLADASVAEVRGYIEQLLGFGLLEQTGNEYPVLGLTPTGIALLKNPDAVPGLTLAREKRVPKGLKGIGRPKAGVEAEAWEGVDHALFERLRAERLAIARERGVPPYVIFHDTTLREMARLRPGSLPELLQVKGVGARKAQDLGERFLEAIKMST